MSKLTINAQLEAGSKPLLPCGSVWYNRLVEDQLPLAREVALLLNSSRLATDFDELGNWLSGAPGSPVLYPWSFSPADVQLQGPANWGYDPLTNQPLTAPLPPTDISRPHAYLTDDGRIVETQTGDPDSLPADITLAEQTVWFLPRPQDFHPVMMISVSQTLTEGPGFVVAGNWVMLYQNPQQLWPEGVIPAWCIRVARSWKSSSLRVDNLRTAGREIARYKRASQNLLQFERALCEAAGLPILEADGLIVRQETGGNQVIHWLEDGRSFTLPVSSPYQPGSVVYAGSGHILQLRHQSLQGVDWWRGRPWGAAGLPIFVFRPNFFGFSIKDQTVGSWCTSDGQGLRGRMAFDQDPQLEDQFWDWQAAQERRLGVETLAAGLLGFTADGQTGTANPLEVFTGVYGPWLAVVETSLDVVDPRAFNELLSFIDRERPAGMQVFLTGTSEAFTSPSYYSVFLETGQLVEIETDVVPAIPLGY